MSSPFAPELLAALRNLTTRQPVTLVEIYFADAPGGATTLRAGNGDVRIPSNGAIYEAGIRCDPIRSRIALLSGGPSAVDTKVRILNRKWAVLGGLTTWGSLSTWRWQGALLTIYLWERSLEDAAHKGQVFTGTIDSFLLDPIRDELVLNLLEGRSWNKTVPETVADENTAPNAPDGTNGQPFPIVYGDWNDYAMRAPHTTAYGNKSKQQDAGAGQGVVPLLLTDPGIGAAKVKLLASSHALTDLLDRANGYTIYAAAGDVLAPLDTAGLTETLGASESFIEIDDDNLIAYYGLRPIDVRTAQNTALNPRRAMDPFDETSFATLAQPSNGVLELQIPSGGSSGRIESVQLEMCFVGASGNTHNIRAYPYNPVAAVNGSILQMAATNTTPSFLTGTWDAGWYTQNWDFGGITGSTAPNREVIDIRVDWAGGTTNTAKILWVVLKVKYRPQRSVVTPNRVVSQGGPFVERFHGSWIVRNDFRQTEIPATHQVESQFFANLKGIKDDGSGTYTGTANALIEAAPDILRHFLAVICGQTQFETAWDEDDPTVGFGSFVKARHLLRSGTPATAKLACWIGGSQMEARSVVGRMAEQSLSCVLFDRFTGKWTIHPWTPGTPADYDRVLTREDLPDLFNPSIASDVDLLQGERIEWGFDHFKGRTAFETFVTPKGSSMGHSLPSWRDQQEVVITNSNKYIDVRRASTDLVGTVALGTYTRPETLATAAETAINAALASDPSFAAQRVWCGHGWTIVAGVNDELKLRYNTSQTGTPNWSGLAVITIPAGPWATPERLAVEVGRVLNEEGIVAGILLGGTEVLTFKCTYTAAGKFRIECFEQDVQIDLDQAGANYTMSSGWAALGFDAQAVLNARGGFPDPYSDDVLLAPDPRYRERSYVAWKAATSGLTGSLKWGTGANAANNCAFELGFDKADVAFASPNQGIISVYPREMRERTALDSQNRYGPKVPDSLVADWVHDENSALLLRNGRFDYTNVPRVPLRFVTHVCPDLQLMRVLPIAADVDGKAPYPKLGSDGSWAGKGMRVIETEQEIDRTYHVEVLAVEA